MDDQDVVTPLCIDSVREIILRRLGVKHFSFFRHVANTLFTAGCHAPVWMCYVDESSSKLNMESGR